MTTLPALEFPFVEMPAYGKVQEVAEGLLWVRIPLPYVLDHVNVFLLQDHDGWAVIDTGTRTPEAIGVWEALFAGPLSGMKISRVVVTHFHPDHIGLAGWFHDLHGARVQTSLSTHALCRLLSQGRSEQTIQQNFDFFLRHGLSPETAELISIHGREYPQYVAPLPSRFQRLVHGDTLTIGARSFRVMTGDGHAPEQVMLHCADEGLFFAADQVLERISPNISVDATEPMSDPLGHFMRSLRQIEAEVPDNVLVLPGHHRPFKGLSARCRDLVLHHQERCDTILAACAKRPHSAADLVPLLFQRQLDPHQMWFAITETLAHANRLIRRSQLTVIDQSDRSLLTLA
ncbi:MBL fold metallo-hydrolase [Paracoccus sp. S-4012]|uniref:MBL fold metallo-hydrolase n=1 Tax=Paracoccus sp. S-4012 TaxID=2665648 RepID=UPI0012B014AD|nr:MBL fold metallo-hydrolase [Paracoccus sp. S-4012]MRX48890.1 MBL fold metallo-hydrolase [Paracoccus sp. S-4012]